jgi:hypothetical protein
MLSLPEDFPFPDPTSNWSPSSWDEPATFPYLRAPPPIGETDHPAGQPAGGVDSTYAPSNYAPSFQSSSTRAPSPCPSSVRSFSSRASSVLPSSKHSSSKHSSSKHSSSKHSHTSRSSRDPYSKH